MRTILHFLFPRGARRAILLTALILTAAPAIAWAQTDEIQVYDAAIAEPGVFNIMLHTNFTPSGQKDPAFPGAIVPNHSFNSVPEWAWGITPWFEQGLYLPVYSISQGRGATLDSMKLRELFVRPHADMHTFFYGINFEFSFNARYWESRRYSAEARPIIGLHLHQWDLIVNPIFDTGWDGANNLEFVPAERIAYNFNPKWAGAIEEYADYGPVKKFLPGSEQSHSLWAVVNHPSKAVDLEFGIGFGLTSATDKVTLKLMVSRDLNHPHDKTQAANFK